MTRPSLANSTMQFELVYVEDMNPQSVMCRIGYVIKSGESSMFACVV